MTPACLNTTCRNCNATLTGEYCGRCGQRDGRDDLTFGELAGEVFEDFFRWDSRIWRTLLPLLFRLGFLAAEFIAGRRARYVPPFRLYLIVSFVLFLVLSLTAGDAISIRGDADLSPHPAAQGQVTGDSGSEPVIAPSAANPEVSQLRPDSSVALLKSKTGDPENDAKSARSNESPAAAA